MSPTTKPLRTNIKLHLNQQKFIARALQSHEQAKHTKEYCSAEYVLSELQNLLTKVNT